MTAYLSDDDQVRTGYQAQMAWLQGQSLPSALHALNERLATAEDNAFNAGGNEATRDYIKRIESFPSALRAVGVGEGLLGH